MAFYGNTITHQIGALFAPARVLAINCEPETVTVPVEKETEDTVESC